MMFAQGIKINILHNHHLAILFSKTSGFQYFRRIHVIPRVSVNIAFATRSGVFNNPSLSGFSPSNFKISNNELLELQFYFHPYLLPILPYHNSNNAQFLKNFQVSHFPDVYSGIFSSFKIADPANPSWRFKMRINRQFRKI